MTIIGLSRYDLRLMPDDVDTGAICPECETQYTTEDAKEREGVCQCGERLVSMDDYMPSDE